MRLIVVGAEGMDSDDKIQFDESFFYLYIQHSVFPTVTYPE